MGGEGGGLAATHILNFEYYGLFQRSKLNIFVKQRMFCYAAQGTPISIFFCFRIVSKDMKLLVWEAGN